MNQSIYKIKKTLSLKKKARLLYKQGLSLRQVGKAIGRTHEWVRRYALVDKSHSKTVDTN